MTCGSHCFILFPFNDGLFPSAAFEVQSESGGSVVLPDFTFPMDPVVPSERKWDLGKISYHLEDFVVPSQTVAMDP